MKWFGEINYKTIIEMKNNNKKKIIKSKVIEMSFYLILSM